MNASQLVEVYHGGDVEGNVRRSPYVYYAVTGLAQPRGRPAAPSQETYRICSITIDFSHPECKLEDALNCDWAMFDVHTSRLTALRRVTLGFSTREDLSTFVQAVAEPKMPKLLQREKLMYAIREKGGHMGDWMYASPYSDVVEGTSSRLIRG